MSDERPMGRPMRIAKSFLGEYISDGGAGAPAEKGCSKQRRLRFGRFVRNVQAPIFRSIPQGVPRRSSRHSGQDMLSGIETIPQRPNR